MSLELQQLDNNPNHLLIQYSLCGDLEKVQQVIESHGPIAHIGLAFLTACSNGHLNIVEYLFPRVGLADHGFLCARDFKQLHIMEYLVDFVLNLNFRLQDCSSILPKTLEESVKLLNIIKKLISRGANDLYSPFQTACLFGNDEIVNFYIGMGVKYVRLLILYGYFTQAAQIINETGRLCTNSDYFKLSRYRTAQLLNHGATKLKTRMAYSVRKRHFNACSKVLECLKDHIDEIRIITDIIFTYIAFE